MRIVYWVRIPLAREPLIERFGRLPGVEFTVVETLPDLLRELPGSTGIVLADAPEAQARQVLELLDGSAATVRWMHFITAGQDGFEAAGLPADVAITRPGLGVGPTVAEHAMALLLALVRRIPEVANASAQARWDRTIGARMSSLEGKTAAIVGFGNVGREIASRARAFKMEIVAVGRSARAEPLADSFASLDQLPTILGRADVVVLSLALTERTRHLFDARAFAAMRADAILINVARGGIVDQEALCNALSTGKIAAAGLDVTDPEPLPADDPLWRCPNILISSHLAGAGSIKSQERIADGALENFLRLKEAGQLA